MVTSRVSRLSPFFLDFSRNEALVSELTDMALYTYENHGTAIRTLSEVQVSASGMCDAGEDVLRRVRSTLMALERTKAHSLASRKCRWMGLCHEELHEVEWTVKMLNAIVPMLDQRIADAVKVSARLLIPWSTSDPPIEAAKPIRAIHSRAQRICSKYRTLVFRDM